MAETIVELLTDVADAIREKKGTTEKINAQNFANEIKNLPSGGGEVVEVERKDVNFRDYDGTILHSYTKDAFLALAEMPTLPTRQGLTCQGWNYNFEDAKANVEEYGKLDVGATYITDDGKTRLYITIAAEGRMDVPLKLQQSVSEGVVVDWGDGSTETFSETSATILRHTYGKVGAYVITLEVLSGTLTLSGSSSSGIFEDTMKVYSNMLQKVEIGNGVTSIGSYAFFYCYSLASIVIPNGVTSIGSYAFNYCYSLASIVIPNGVTAIGNYTFQHCYSLASIVIPNGLTTIGSQAFYNCSSVAFYDFSTHAFVPTLSATIAFKSIPSDCKIVVPDALYESWIAATNWSSYASNIIKASEFNG